MNSLIYPCKKYLLITVLVVYCHVTNYLKTQQQKVTNICYCTNTLHPEILWARIWGS